LFKKLFNRLSRSADTAPEQAYDLWAKAYDAQPGNLMLHLDELVFSALLNDLDIRNNFVTDIGCGTGRHWQKILDRNPAQLSGYDVSEGMLQILQQKFPNAITHKLDHGNNLLGTADQSVDLIISTLTIAHIEDPEDALQEWNRILKPSGHIIITDYHPAALQKGGKRTFLHGDKQVSIVNHVHSIEKLTQLAGQLQWQPIRLEEKAIDESVRSYYEQQNALSVYKAFLGVPVIYGILFKKNDAT